MRVYSTTKRHKNNRHGELLAITKDIENHDWKPVEAEGSSDDDNVKEDVGGDEDLYVIFDRLKKAIHRDSPRQDSEDGDTGQVQAASRSQRSQIERSSTRFGSKTYEGNRSQSQQAHDKRDSIAHEILDKYEQELLDEYERELNFDDTIEVSQRTT